MQIIIRITLTAIAALLVFGCEVEETFISCPFDDTINKTCEADDEGLNMTCVVAEHPQCPNDVCIRWKSADHAVCSMTCSPDGAACPGASSCMPFNENSNDYYCVPNSLLE